MAIPYTWAVVQVNLGETNEGRASLKAVRWHGPHPENTKYKLVWELSYRPIVHRTDKGSFFLGQQIISLEKVHFLLDRNADMQKYQLDINLKKNRLSDVPFLFLRLVLII